MATNDPLPRETREIDEEIEETRQELKGVIRRRRLIFLTCGVGIFAEATLIFFAIKTGDPNAEFSSFAGPLGIFVLLPGLVAVGVGVSADADSATFDIARATVIKRRMELQQLSIERRELLIGASSGPAVPLARYRESMPELVAHYRGQANRYRSLNNFLQAFVIIASLGVSAITGLLAASNDVRVGTVIITLAIAISSSIGSFFRLQERGAQLQKTADLIEIEFRAVELGINDYANLKKVDALRLFVEKVEKVRSEHMTRQRQLNEPADLRHLDPSSISIDRRNPALWGALFASLDLWKSNACP